MQKEGILRQRAVEAVEQTESALLDAVTNHGGDHQSGWEDVRQRYIFRPSEEDQPILGQDQGSTSPETAQRTTTASPNETTSAPEASEPSTRETSLPSEPSS